MMQKLQKWKMVFFLSGVFTVGCILLSFFFNEEKPQFPDDPRVDRSFITGNPCEAPCWYGLSVGESTLDDIYKTLPNLPFADTTRIYEGPTGEFRPLEKRIDIPCIYSKELDACASLETTGEGILRSIFVNIDYELTLRMAIQRLGNPAYLTVAPSPNIDICTLEIYWPEDDIVAFIDENDWHKYCSREMDTTIDLDLQIVSLVYIDIGPQDQQNLESIPWSRFQH